MKRIFYTLIALFVTIVACAQERTITVYGYDSDGNLSYTPLFVSSDKVKVVFNDGREYVDLGLPSKTLWATCNVGASKPEEYGDYFAWGETTPKDTYNWDTYKWCDRSDDTMSKYCDNNNFGTIDNKKTLDSEDDVATVNWGSNWCMPTHKQIEELLLQTEKKWTTLNNVNGVKLTSKINGNSIFLPAAGYRSYRTVRDAGVMGGYWSCSVGSLSAAKGTPSDASEILLSMETTELFVAVNYEHRLHGCSVRPVRVQK